MAVEIKLTNKWVLRSQPRCFVLAKKKIAQSGKKEGEVVYQDDSYYSDLKSALIRIPERILLEDDDTLIESFNDLMREIQKYNKMIAGFVHECGVGQK